MPHYDRPAGFNKSSAAQGESVLDDEVDAMDEAAQALREAEVEAVQPTPSKDSSQLETLSIDELRSLAAKLGVPNRGTITVREQLIAALRQRM